MLKNREGKIHNKEEGKDKQEIQRQPRVTRKKKTEVQCQPVIAIGDKAQKMREEQQNTGAIIYN